MQRLNSNLKRGGLAVVVVAVLFGLSGSGWAKGVRTRVHASVRTSNRMIAKGTLAKMTKTAKPLPVPEALAVPGVMPNELEPETAVVDGTAAAITEAPTAGAKDFRLRMDNMHTGEKIDIVYRVGNVYIPEALERLNAFLRDHNTNDVVDYAPKEFDVLHAMMARLGRAGSGVIDVVCGYRTPETNEALRHSSVKTGVAEHSQHMEGHAIDLRVPGVSTVALRNAALSLHAGGVGFYPITQFVHIDVGPVRQWVFGPKPRRPGRKTHSQVASGM